MFREMRRHGQALPHEECEAILHAATSGVLSLLGDDDYPYGVPLSHLYTPACLYFHGAQSGHKADAIARHGKASFCVIAQDEVDAPTFSTRYRSVIVFGRIRIVEDEAEKRRAIEALAERFSPGLRQAAQQEIAESWHHMHMFALDIEHITGKEARSLMQERKERT